MGICEDCRAAFAQLDESEDRLRALHLDELQPYCRCQTSSVSAHSPGPVVDEEILIRVVVAPEQVKKGKPTPATISGAESGGLSLMRQNEATDAIVRAVAKGLVDRARARRGDQANKVGVFGILEIRCGTIRAAKANGETQPAYCVYDTALEHDADGGVSHAEAFQRISQAEKELQLARRKKLFTEVETSFIPVAEFRNGLLSDLAPHDLS
jgi:hypothetical protein